MALCLHIPHFYKVRDSMKLETIENQAHSRSWGAYYGMISQFPDTPQRHSVFTPRLKRSGCDWDGVGRLRIAAAVATASRVPSSSSHCVKYRKGETQHQPTTTRTPRNSPGKNSQAFQKVEKGVITLVLNNFVMHVKVLQK